MGIRYTDSDAEQTQSTQDTASMCVCVKMAMKFMLPNEANIRFYTQCRTDPSEKQIFDHSIRLSRLRTGSAHRHVICATFFSVTHPNDNFLSNRKQTISIYNFLPFEFLRDARTFGKYTIDTWMQFKLKMKMLIFTSEIAE